MSLVLFTQRHTVSHHLHKNYNPLKFSDDPIGDGLIFSDLSKALKSAKELSTVSKSVESKNGRRKFFKNGQRKRKSNYSKNTNSTHQKSQ